MPSLHTRYFSAMYLFTMLLFTSAFAALLGGCAVPEHNAPKIIEPVLLGLQQSTTTAWPKENWWNDFHDTQLEQLIERALSDSPSIKIAQARVDLAQQDARITRAVNQPQLGLNASVSRDRHSENGNYPPPTGDSTSTQARITLDFSYEFDFWGRQRAELASALKQVDVERAEQASARLILSTAIAQNYFSLQALLSEQALLEQSLQRHEKIMQLMQLRVQRGLVNRAELDVATARFADTQCEAAAAQSTIASTTHALAALCGVGPEQLPPIEIRSAESTNAPPSNIPIPADLLARRPDVIAQRLRVEAATSDVTAAKADFYPNIDLRGFFGVQSVGVDRLFNSSSREWSFGPALHLPLFNRDALRAQLGARHANYDLAVEQYNDSILQAIRETADAGTTLQSLAVQREALERSLGAQQRVHAIALDRYRRGLGNQLDALQSELVVLNQQRTALALQNETQLARLALIKALGGGYDARDEQITGRMNK